MRCPGGGGRARTLARRLANGGAGAGRGGGPRGPSRPPPRPRPPLAGRRERALGSAPLAAGGGSGVTAEQEQSCVDTKRGSSGGRGKEEGGVEWRDREVRKRLDPTGKVAFFFFFNKSLKLFVPLSISTRVCGLKVAVTRVRCCFPLPGGGFNA